MLIGITVWLSPDYRDYGFISFFISPLFCFWIPKCRVEAVKYTVFLNDWHQTLNWATILLWLSMTRVKVGSSRFPARHCSYKICPSQKEVIVKLLCVWTLIACCKQSYLFREKCFPGVFDLKDIWFWSL